MVPCLGHGAHGVRRLKKKAKTRKVDLLNGPVLRSLVKLALPIMAGSFIGLAYNLTDMFWVGGLGHEALAAVGTGGVMLWFSEGVLTMTRVGGQIYAGQAYGRGDMDEVREYGRESLRLAYGLATLIALIYFVFSHQLVGIFNLNTPSTIRLANEYLRVVAFGMPFSFGARIFGTLFTAIGNSHTPFVLNAAGLVMNMILDPLLINVAHLSAAGAALATILSQFTVFVLMYVAFRRDALWGRVRVTKHPVSTRAMKNIVRLGAPPALQSIIMSSVTTVLSRIVAGFGDMSVAVQRLGAQVESISWMTADGFSLAVNAFIAQNFGAGQGRRVKRGYYSGFLLVSITCLFTTALLFFFAGPITGIFIRDAVGIGLGRDYFRILSLSQWMMGVEIVTVAAFSALGQSVYPAVVTVAATLGRIPLARALAGTHLGVNGVWWSITLMTIVGGLVLAISYVIYLNRLEKKAILLPRPPMKRSK